MIVDKVQRGNIVEVSYINTEGEIDVAKYDIYANNGYGLYDYEICDEDDPQKHPALRHYLNNQPIKRISSWRLDFDEFREFLKVSIPETEREKIFAFNMFDLHMLDIEINTTGGDVFPDPHKAEFPIDSIQITGKDLSTLILTNNERALNCDIQRQEVEDAINEHYKDIHYVKDRIKYSHIKFETETEMLNFFYDIIRKKLHSVSFWHGEGFDVPYLWNRCRILNINIGMGSPTGEVSEFHRWPRHRFVSDYMKLTEKYGYDIDRSTFSLDHCASEIIGIGKISHDGYNKVYQGPIVKFLTYGAVDTIAMQLIHRIKNYAGTEAALVYYCGASLYDSGQVTALIHCLLFDELYSNNQINAAPHTKVEAQKYGGGYVKEPARKFAMFSALEDFSALYPRTMQSYNISFENFLGKAKTPKEAEQAKAEGNIVTVNNNIYKNDKDYTLKVVETRLLDERYQYRDLQAEVYLKILPEIDKELKLRNLE